MTQKEYHSHQSFQAFSPTTYRAPLVRVSRKRPCPVCGRTDWCSVRADESACICMRRPSDRPTRNGGFLHVFSFDETPPAPRPQPIITQPTTPERAPVTRLDPVYTDLRRLHLVLSKQHREEKLNRRGLSDSAIEVNGYRSTPTQGYAANVARALARDYDLTGIPGFYRDAGEWRLNFGEWTYGIIIPVRDTLHRIRALMIRRDDVSGSGKYIWLSSKDKPHGASPGAPPHFANVEAARASGEIIVSEGALKSDVIAELTGQGVCGIAGVTNFTETFGADLRRALPELKRAVVAFDADFRTNENVRRGLDRLIRNLQSSGLKVSVRVWQSALGKGFDDALVALKGAA